MRTEQEIRAWQKQLVKQAETAVTPQQILAARGAWDACRWVLQPSGEGSLDRELEA